MPGRREPEQLIFFYNPDDQLSLKLDVGSWSIDNVVEDDYDAAAHRPEVKFSSRSPTLMRIAPGIGSAESHSPVTDLASSPPRSSCREVSLKIALVFLFFD